jgi:alpha-D-xyloside xylohydrolase
MQAGRDFMTDIAEFDLHPDRLLWRAGYPTGGRIEGGAAVLDVPFRAYRLAGDLKAAGLPDRSHQLRVEALDNGALRLRIVFAPGEDAPAPATAMLNPQGIPAPVPLALEKRADGLFVLRSGTERVLVLAPKAAPSRTWSDLIPAAADDFSCALFPDRGGPAFAAWDQFFPGKMESVALGYLEDGPAAPGDAAAGGKVAAALFSFAAGPRERFAGTGERFGKLDLAGRTVVLENTDGLGVNSRRAYKNVPFWLSSSGYGVFVHESARMVLSFADVSTRAAQGCVDASGLDLFVLPGGPEAVLRSYRELTGFPPELPLWSYGVWVAKMTYFSEAEVLEVVERLRKEDFPFDLVHLDTGWFQTDWVCEWRFSAERFPDPERFMRVLREKGVRVSLWQTPNIGEGNILLEEAKAKRYLAPAKEGLSTASDFSGQDFGGQIDFTYPAAEKWYRGMLRNLFQMGAAVIKTDFGEKIAMNADYAGLPARKLRNLYGLLYQKAAFEETAAATGAGIVWARSGWAGCQRYPLHWGGDAAATWDGLAASIRGGLQLGMSGFGYWASDVGGFHGLPEFMNDGPTPDLYLRWTQAMVFASHFRYHGTSDREPYAFPEVAAEVRAWLRLRYALIPYLRSAGAECARTGYPVLRSLALDWSDDPAAWAADTQYLCGRDLLVSPVLDDAGTAEVYLPAGVWRDFWTGERIEGPRRIPSRAYPRSRIPVYLRDGARIPYHPEPVSCTDAMASGKEAVLAADGAFAGVGSTPLGRLCGLK